MNSNSCKVFFLLLLVFAISISISAQEKWKLERSCEGINIYSGNIAGSDFKSFKAQMVIKGSVHAFIAVLQDINNMPAWGYNMKNTKLLEKNGDTLQIYYAEVSAPFPFDNRDGIYLNKFTWDSKSSQLFVGIELLPDYLKTKNKIVRLKGKGYWTVRVLKNDMLDITFVMQVDPGGNIPAWMVNIMVDTTPFSTMKEIRKVMSESKYQNRRFGFIKM